MQKEQLLQYYDDLCRLARAKCNTQHDADDLVSETMLAAFAFLARGGVIEHPKTWLTNTLLHKFHDALRQKYRSPVFVGLESVSELASDEQTDKSFAESEEAAAVRRELIYLAKITREVMIRRYYRGESVRAIARALSIPEGTVKSRLSAGRERIRKGLLQMENRDNQLPGVLHISFTGRDGADGRPMSLVEGDLIAQNLLLQAYEKPLTLPELASRVGIPTAYIEPIVQKLYDGELMARTAGEKYYTDFIIYTPEDSLRPFDMQIQFAKTHFDTVWGILSDMLAQIGGMEYTRTLRPAQRKKLERYAILKALQDFTLQKTSVPPRFDYVQRKDGGAWFAMGWGFPAGYDFTEYEDKIGTYTVSGHRTHQKINEYFGAKHRVLCEFDTTLYDSPRRFTACGFEHYFDGILDLLWCVHQGVSPEEGGIKNEPIGAIDQFKTLGLLTQIDGGLAVDVPVMHADVMREGGLLIDKAVERIDRAIGEDYRALMKRAALTLPTHLTSVPDALRSSRSNCCIPMAFVYEAYEQKLHLHDIDYCCPPVVLVYE